ncbi:GTP 3',8-cyclase MoaA [Geomesophilobacter sediminis]|uniref:GTP 3',8-cyclase n=1 Tax=Geomesophilobacter sediminis TaxID=2798584 RepID=A0A8J7IYK7_9BACT|nr:GTP 3',8-cyclase MoaA [Geomesophilobacter sediminis]MBJ6725282.1 GTP 3',8-cyclase MoaA [Geomesophilobacter sediminis]
MELVDTFGRRINYLRLSITDRCNMRCRYCMPAEGVEKLTHSDVLSYEELLRIGRAAVNEGVEKIRVTGGEPLVRKGILPFLSSLSALPGLRQLVLTTNGVLLEELAAPLHAAGVQRLNVSLDSLDPARFAAVTRGGDLSRVLAGIEAARREGFPIKLNMVVMRGVNDDEVESVASLALDAPFSVRFIEYMPSSGEERWQSLVVPGEEILRRLSARFTLELVDRGALSGPAREYRIPGAAGTVGIITPVTGHFCGDCNRIRVTSTGKAKSCLFSGGELDLRPYLQEGDAALQEALRRIVREKPHRHQLTQENDEPTPFAMSKIGG